MLADAAGSAMADDTEYVYGRHDRSMHLIFLPRNHMQGLGTELYMVGIHKVLLAQIQELEIVPTGPVVFVSQ